MHATVTDNYYRDVGVLTENIELQGSLGLTDHVLGTAYDHLPIIIRRQVRQGDAALHLRRVNLLTSLDCMTLVKHVKVWSDHSANCTTHRLRICLVIIRSCIQFGIIFLVF